MSQLPNCERAVVSVEKVRDYLLNDFHPEGGSKARFFKRFGFSAENWEALREAILRMACTGELIRVVERPPYGSRYVTRARLPTPDDRNPEVTIAWFINTDDETRTPRLATVVPDNRKRP